MICTEKGIDGYANYPGHIQTLKNAGIPIKFIGSSFDRSIESLSINAEELSSFLKNNHFDLAHTHAAVPSLLSMTASSLQACKIPVIQTMHGWGIYKTQQQNTQDLSILELVDHLVFVSKSSEKLLLEQGLQKEERSVIYNGISQEKNSPDIDQDLCKLLKYKSEGFLIAGAVGTVDRRKNQRLIIEAARQIHKEFKIKFFIVGEGENIKDLKRLVAKYGLTEIFHFTGYKKFGRSFIQAFDCLISSSLSEGGPPLCIMEAFAAKVLVLASDTPEHREAVVPKQTGFLFKNNNADDLAKFLNEILQKAPYDKIKTRAFDFFQSHFDFNRSYHNYSSIYQSLLR